jgi:ankyrin repeat protein
MPSPNASAPDIRAIRAYESSQDRNFIIDTIYSRIRSHSTSDRNPFNKELREFVKVLPDHVRAGCMHARDVVAAGLDVIHGRAQFSQMVHLARICGCEMEPNHTEDGVYSTHEVGEYLRVADLRKSIHNWTEDQFTKIEKLKEELFGRDTTKKIKYLAFGFVLDNDSDGLCDFLTQLPSRSPRQGRSGVGAKCKCAICKPQWEMPSLEDVLLATDKYGWTPLQWAAELGHAGVISIILDKASNAKSKNLFTDVLHAVEVVDDAPAVFKSVFNADVDCILAFLHGGADFTTPCGADSISILEYLVHLASTELLKATYIPILDMVLKYMLAKNPKLDLTAPIWFQKPVEVDLVEEVDCGTDNDDDDGEVVVEETEAANGDDNYNDITNNDDDDDDNNNLRRIRSRRTGLLRFAESYGQRNPDRGHHETESEIFIPGFTLYEEIMCTPDERMKVGWRTNERLDSYVLRYRLRQNERWADANATLLSIAVDKIAVEVVQLLLESGADPNYPIPVQSTRNGGGASGGGEEQRCAILCFAATSRSIDIFDTSKCLATIQVLLDAGANINAVQQGTKDTALITAAKWGMPEIAVMLLNNGADPTIRNADGMNAVEAAQHGGEHFLAELLGRELRLQRLVDVIEAKSTSNDINNNDGSNSTIVDVPEVPEDMQCGICWENERCITLAPCGHRRLCSLCALKVLSKVKGERICPFCKVTIESYIIRVFD